MVGVAIGVVDGDEVAVDAVASGEVLVGDFEDLVEVCGDAPLVEEEEALVGEDEESVLVAVVAAVAAPVLVFFSEEVLGVLDNLAHELHL